MHDTNHVAVLDFGSQYTQLIVRRVRELGYFAKLYAIEDFPDIGKPGAIILSGGPKSTSEPDAPDLDFEALKAFDVPVLGVCYGMQLLNIKFGGSVEASNRREYGPANLFPAECAGLYEGVSASSQVWMSHSDTVKILPDGATIIARNQHGTPVSLQWNDKFFGIQFHPEVTHSHEGLRILHNFLLNASHLLPFRIDDFKREIIDGIREKIGNKQIVCGVSGGVDSTVLAVLLHEAGANVRAIFVDHGLMRKNEGEEVRNNFHRMGVPIETVDCAERFLKALEGVDDPEKKRVIIGNLFIDVFWDSVGDAEMLAQGTLYPDVVESGGGTGTANIKSHHNVGGLPDDLKFKLVEPLRTLFKDEVRQVGIELGLPEEIVWRQPFPGPGLGIRIIGEVTAERLEILRHADLIARNELKAAGLDRDIWQCPVVLLADVRSVGVQGDGRTYGHPIVLRPVSSEDAMTADWSRVPYEVLEKISTRITNEVREVNRVVLDVTSKPPGTIEWE